MNVVLPAIRLAAFSATGNVRFIVHTDSPQLVGGALKQFEHEIRSVPSGKSAHYSMGLANREAMAAARMGEIVAFMNADMVPSREVFFAAENRFEQGKRLIMMAASRTIGGHPPAGAKSADLLRWTMAHRHPAIVDLFYGAGQSTVPWSLYFFDGETVVMHGFHLHPFAYLKDRDHEFGGATIDGGLVSSFAKSEIHLVTNADESSFAEMSPKERTFPRLAKPLDNDYVASWARGHATEMHCWLFSKSIAIVGDGDDIGDRAVCADILAKVERDGGPLAIYR